MLEKDLKKTGNKEKIREKKPYELLRIIQNLNIKDKFQRYLEIEYSIESKMAFVTLSSLNNFFIEVQQYKHSLENKYDFSIGSETGLKFQIKSESTKTEKLIWKKDKKDLAYLIDELIRIGFLAGNKNINKLISQHFSYNDLEIKPTEIADLKSKIKNNTYPLYPSPEIVDTITKVKDYSKVKHKN